MPYQRKRVLVSQSQFYDQLVTVSTLFQQTCARTRIDLINARRSKLQWWNSMNESTYFRQRKVVFWPKDNILSLIYLSKPENVPCSSPVVLTNQPIQQWFWDALVPAKNYLRVTLSSLVMQFISFCQAQRTINHSLFTVLSMTYRLTLVLSVLTDKASMGSFFGLFGTSSVRPSQDLNPRRYCSKATA